MYHIYHDLEIKASPDKVYRAVTDPKHLINWWPLKCSGNPEKGEEYNYFFGPEYDWLAQVSDCSENEYIYFKMTRSDPDWDPTSFGYQLEAKEDGIQLKFSHKNWPACNGHFRHSSFCWAILLKGLKDYLETGKIIPFEDRE
ncbi:MAG: SRPBCC domain-containing protein [Bacteroidetes bacterium]|nr:SRPBCC domain-containing protein [Bacteroidota bacterium]